ncbi:MAG: histidine kinase, partial [Bacteroidota bacterium]
INYGLKALLTLPLLWLFFRPLSSLAIWKKGILHLITMPIFALIWIKIYYLICDYLGIFRLQGSREVWDVYLTILFYSIQFGVFHLYVYSKKLREEQLLSAELSKLKAESELSALKAQLNPHFLYNVFNTINAAIPITAKHARNMVNELSDLFRYQLKASREKMVPLKEELDFVQKYLDLEKERFGERLQFEINVTPELEGVLTPPLIVQPLVENSIKHGISPLIEGGAVEINVARHGDELRIAVCDTGKGPQGQEKSTLLQKGVGLANTNERLLKMYGKGLALNENEQKGFCVSFSIPIAQQR